MASQIIGPPTSYAYDNKLHGLMLKTDKVFAACNIVRHFTLVTFLQ